MLGLKFREHYFHPMFESKAMVVNIQERCKDLVWWGRRKTVRFAQMVGADCQDVEQFVMNILGMDREGDL